MVNVSGKFIISSLIPTHNFVPGSFLIFISCIKKKFVHRIRSYILFKLIQLVKQVIRDGLGRLDLNCLRNILNAFISLILISSVTSFSIYVCM